MRKEFLNLKRIFKKESVIALSFTFTFTFTNINQEDVKKRKGQHFQQKTTLFLQLLMQNPGFQAATKHTFPGQENRMLRGV